MDVKVYRKRVGLFLAGAMWVLLVEGVCLLALSGALGNEPPLPIVLSLVAPVILIMIWE